MEPLLGRTVSQIKNRYYQNLKGKDLTQIKYKNNSAVLVQSDPVASLPVKRKTSFELDQSFSVGTKQRRLDENSKSLICEENCNSRIQRRREFKYGLK